MSGERSTGSRGFHRAIREDIHEVRSALGSDCYAIGIFELQDDDFVFVTPNEMLAGILGKSADELAGRSAKEIGLPTGLTEQWIKTLRRCRGKRIAGTDRFFSPCSGCDRWFEYSLSYVEGSGNLFFCIASEITERRRTENALKESEAFLNSVFESIGDGISVLDCDMNIIRVNRVMEEWYSHAMPLQGKKCYAAYHGHTVPCEDCPSRRAIESRTTVSAIRPFQGEGGEIKGWLEVSAFPLLGQHGVSGVIEHVRDISARRKAEMALIESEEKYRLLAETARDMIYIIDNDYRVKYVNRSAAESLGGVPEDILGKPLEALFPGETARAMKAGLKRVFDSGKPLEHEMEHRFPGRVIPMHVILAPFCDANGKIAGVMGISRDITRLKKAEEALRESEQTKAVLMDGIPESMLLLDRNGTILDANTVLARKLHKDRADLIGAYAYDFIDPGDARRRKDKIEEVFRTGRQCVFEDERAGVCFENIVTPVLSMDGRVERVAIIAIDITGRKRAEEALQDAKQQTELYLDLLGHDINNMHQIALGYLELARSKHPEIWHQEYLDKPIEALQRSSRLIQNVRKLQKLKENSPALGAVDMIRVLRDVQREYGESSGKKITLYLNGYDSCHVLGNELLHDVFANLVSNAVKHTGAGTEIGITLETKAENEGGYCRVAVEDNGPGIPDNAKGWIFGRSMKGTSVAKGMGLGLYLVRALVDSYGGQVSVEDRVPGDYTQGARFVVTLPVAGQK